ncbi:MAG: methylisocitrate lyase [Waddliaceae bacterium]
MFDGAGKRLWKALKREKPLQMVGTINAYVAKMAQSTGFQAIYLSGAGVANASYGFPDLGITTLDNVLEDVRRITFAVDTPLLVDIDTGWGSSLTIQRAVKEIERAGAAGIHIEDQEFAKRCGQLPGKQIVSIDEMVSRITAAVEAKTNPHFVIMARTDAFASEGIEGAIERAIAYKEAGADMLFPEALEQLEDFRTIKEKTGIPVLANLTEFGKTPLFTQEELKDADIDIALYPLSANRAMNLAALKIFEEIRRQGTQKHCIETMQTREELYYFLDYESYENQGV